MRAHRNDRRFYLSVPLKFFIVLFLTYIWFAVSLYFSYSWIVDLSRSLSAPVAWFVVLGIALIPGAANAFLLSSLILDRRPHFNHSGPHPGVTLIIAAYNEQDSIRSTLESVWRQVYDGPLQVLVIDDGSQDQTAEIVKKYALEVTDINPHYTLELLVQPQNRGKSYALNLGLSKALYDFVVTVDADSLLYKNALINIVDNILLGPPNTAAVAGTVLVRNSRVNFLTKLQEWDYFHGISVVKRAQSLFHGTLVAQGAFSIYRKEALLKVGGWSHTIGEDIVLTWAFHDLDYRVSYAENAFVFTNVPETYGQFYRQRKRWARGLMEAFDRYSGLIVKFRMYTPYIFLNTLFPYLDAVYLAIFVPAALGAIFFQYYAIVGIMTISVLPVAFACNYVMFIRQREVFKRHGLIVRRNVLGFTLYVLLYQVLLSPASVAGYLSEFFRVKKSWGTK